MFKKFVPIIALNLLLCSTAFANNITIERFYEFTKNNKKVVEEINYYLSKGAEVKILHTVSMDRMGDIYNTMVLKIPKEVFENEPYQSQK